MKTVKCDKHNTLIVVLEPSEEGIFSSKLDATVVFYDERKVPYLKRFIRGGCDDNCPTVMKTITPVSSTPALMD